MLFCTFEYHEKQSVPIRIKNSVFTRNKQKIRNFDANFFMTIIKITSWKDLNNLPITPTLLEQIKQPLRSPFHNEDEHFYICQGFSSLIRASIQPLRCS